MASLLDELPESIRRPVSEALSRGAGGPVAFDADGTLWRGDVGEELLRLLAHEDRLPSLQGRRGLYEEYERRVERDPADAYAWCVEVMRDFDERELNDACAALIQSRFAGRFFRPVLRILKALQGAGCPVWIVSASPFWPVAAGARLLEVPLEQVVGVRCPVKEGRLTGEVERPVPCDEGKVHALRTRGVRPVLAFGNGVLDAPMLAYAEQAIVVAPPGERNGLTEEADRQGWPTLRC